VSTVLQVAAAVVMFLAVVGALVWNAVVTWQEGRQSPQPKKSLAELREQGWLIWEELPEEAAHQLALF
jgi:hypothetical protein